MLLLQKSKSQNDKVRYNAEMCSECNPGMGNLHESEAFPVPAATEEPVLSVCGEDKC